MPLDLSNYPSVTCDYEQSTADYLQEMRTTFPHVMFDSAAFEALISDQGDEIIDTTFAQVAGFLAPHGFDFWDLTPKGDQYTLTIVPVEQRAEMPARWVADDGYEYKPKRHVPKRPRATKGTGKSKRLECFDAQSELPELGGITPEECHNGWHGHFHQLGEKWVEDGDDWVRVPDEAATLFNLNEWPPTATNMYDENPSIGRSSLFLLHADADSRIWYSSPPDDRYDDERMVLRMLVAFQMFSGKLSQPLLRLVGLWHQFQQARISIARLGDIMNAPTERYSTVPGRPGRGEGTIQLDQLAFRYTDTGPFLYENLNLRVEAGHAIAIVGPSGCGKSTLAKLLQRFYLPSAGRILVDGIDLQNLSANELRGRYGVVPQETTLFSGTILDNLQMANPGATLDEIAAACRMAEIHSTIEAMPEGYMSEIGERGAGLSGGQKQRLAIARALLRRPSVLIFDEATSALDSQTAEQFARTIDSLRGKVTIVFITHAGATRRGDQGYRHHHARGGSSTWDGIDDAGAEG